MNRGPHPKQGKAHLNPHPKRERVHHARLRRQGRIRRGKVPVLRDRNDLANRPGRSENNVKRLV